MAPEYELHCDDEGFAEWTSTTVQAPSVIEQIPAAAHNGAAGNHIVVNQDDKVAYASLQNWASAMALGDMRVIGFWWKVLTPPPATAVGVVATSINAGWAALLALSLDNEVRLTTLHDGGTNLTAFAPLFTGTEWHYVRLVVIRHATAGGAQLYDGANLLIDDAKYDTTNTYNGTPDWLHTGCHSAALSGFEMYQDEFRIAKTLAGAQRAGISGTSTSTSTAA
jgi:hypothetical protein